MPSTSIVSGVLLILLGISGYAFSLIDGRASLTALIPAAFGLLLLIFGALAKSKENLRKHLMHAAVLVALAGFLIPAIRVISQLARNTTVTGAPPYSSGNAATTVISLAVLSQIAMALICLAFVILSVKSFIDARRNRVI